MMRLTGVFAAALLTLVLVPTVNYSQGGQMEASRGVEGGGVSVPGWTGKIDAKEETAGLTLNSARFVKEGDALHITTGPAVTYWNTKNKASGDYTVKATFKEPKYMNLNSHPHPYGVVIAGNDLGTEAELPLLRRLRQRQLYRPRLWTGAVSDEWQGRRVRIRGEQGGRNGRTGNAGDRVVREGRQSRVRDQ